MDTMDRNSSHSGSSQHRTISNSGHNLGEQSTSKVTLTQSFELQQLDTEAHRPVQEKDRQHPTWPVFTRKINQAVAAKFPSTHRYVSRAIVFLRGPRPQVELPYPHPILDIDYTIRNRHLHVPIETTLRRTTRLFTRPWLFLIFTVAYVIGLAFLTRAQSFLTPSSSFIGCTATYWSANNGCGLDGNLCGPFNDNTTFDFRCPAQCQSVILQNPRAIGAESIAFVPLVIGGGDPEKTYRADSFICSAAIHAGLISNSRGGCAALQLTGNFTNFLSTTSNGIASTAFPTIFPASFRFLDSTALTRCSDLRNPALAVNILVLCLIIIILRPAPIVTYWSLVLVGYWHVSLFSQPRDTPPPLEDIFGTFLPTCFVCYAFWRVAFRFTMPAFSAAPIESTILYLGPFWVGLLHNLTFDKLPLSRLTSSDLTKRSGAIATLVVLVLVVLLCALNQMWMIRKTGWLPYYVGWYVVAGIALLVMALLPGLNLRLHHYIFGIIFIPGTGFPTRMSAIYQGLLLGLFLNGVAAYDFDSILQTTASLRQDATFGSYLPTFLTNSTNYNTSIGLNDQIISWLAPPDGWDGFSLLVDDVERYIGRSLNFSLAAFDVGIPHFIRLALTQNGVAGDFTKAATILANNTWINPAAGAT